MAKQSPRVILASRFKQATGWRESDALNVTRLTRAVAQCVRAVTEWRGARD
jgi:hypothetical protein